MVARQGLRGEGLLDLSSPLPVTERVWDCRKPEDSEWARQMLWRDKPRLVVVCPPCTLFSQLQRCIPQRIARAAVP